MLYLKITAETPEELKQQLLDLTNSLASPREQPEKDDAPSFPAETAPDAPVPEQREDPAVPAVEAPSPTLEETRAALNALRQKKGAAAVRAILTAHGVKSFTELDPNDYAQVMAEVRENG